MVIMASMEDIMNRTIMEDITAGIKNTMYPKIMSMVIMENTMEGIMVDIIMKDIMVSMVTTVIMDIINFTKSQVNFS
uniref:Uncharacterized protein n=1 Tax=Acrobeloides nanus TaxID=290746 RepID=A0A914BXH6_9BILA